jgi:hypothetical protein
MRCISSDPCGGEVAMMSISRAGKVEQRALLSVLFQGEDAVRRRCAMVASRLEIVASAMVLLEVACHADASLDDLDSLAAARGVVLETLAARVHSWAAVAGTWVGHLWPASAFRDYRAVLDAMRQNLAVAAVLGRTCTACGDRRMADWCALWTEQRLGLASRLEATLARNEERNEEPNEDRTEERAEERAPGRRYPMVGFASLLQSLQVGRPPSGSSAPSPSVAPPATPQGELHEQDEHRRAARANARAS